MLEDINRNEQDVDFLINAFVLMQISQCHIIILKYFMSSSQ